jgi:lipopolysaccharide transport system ATP-binding protein
MAYNEFLNVSSEGQSPESGQFNGPDDLASFVPKESNFVHFEDDKSSSIDLAASSNEIPVQKLKALESSARLLEVKVLAGDSETKPLMLMSEVTDLEVMIRFKSSMDVPVPNVGVIITDKTGRNVSSCSNFYDKIHLIRDAQGLTQVSLKFPQIALLRGRYGLSVYLLCEQAIHIYDSASVTEFEVSQPGLELGLVSLKRHWNS